MHLTLFRAVDSCRLRVGTGDELLRRSADLNVAGHCGSTEQPAAASGKLAGTHDQLRGLA